MAKKAKSNLFEPAQSPATTAPAASAAPAPSAATAAGETLAAAKAAAKLQEIAVTLITAGQTRADLGVLPVRVARQVAAQYTPEELATWPVPGSDRPTGNRPADKFKTPAGVSSFYREMFIATDAGRDLARTEAALKAALAGENGHDPGLRALGDTEIRRRLERCRIISATAVAVLRQAVGLLLHAEAVQLHCPSLTVELTDAAARPILVGVAGSLQHHVYGVREFLSRDPKTAAKSGGTLAAFDGARKARLKKDAQPGRAVPPLDTWAVLLDCLSELAVLASAPEKQTGIVAAMTAAMQRKDREDVVLTIAQAHQFVSGLYARIAREYQGIVERQEAARQRGA